MDNQKGILLGALAGSVLGSMAYALYSYREELLDVYNEQSEYLAEQACKGKEYLIDEYDYLVGNKKEESNNQYYVAGGLLGLASGLAATLMLSPKTRKVVQKSLNQAYDGISHTAEDMFHHHEKKPRVRRALAKKSVVKHKSKKAS